MIYELVIEDENVDEVFAISLVEEPAIESNFVFFEKEKVQFAALNDEKRLVMGAILIPNKQILRIDGAGKPYHVFFKPETIKKLSEMYLKKKYTDSSTLEHDKKINGVTLVESWIKESITKDKSSLYGLNAPVGSWMGTFKIDNDEIWNDYVKTGEVKGFSIEGLFGHNLVQQSLFSADTYLSDLEEQEAILILSEIRAVIKKDNRYKGKKRVEMESFSDYGDGVANNAKRGIELNDKNGNKCATPVGKVRAQQLAQRKPISIETIKRMYSYLSRAEAYYDESDSAACGTISYLLWGGKAGLAWSRNKLRELGLLEEAEQPSVSSTYPGEAAKGKDKYKTKALLAIEKPNVNVFGYHTRYFQMCPTASELFEHLVTMQVDEDTKGMIRSAAQAADNVFRKEEEIVNAGIASQHDYEEVVLLVDDFKDIMEEVDNIVGMKHDTSFMDNHIEIVKEYYND
jgi:hypothetical protein